MRSDLSFGRIAARTCAIAVLLLAFARPLAAHVDAVQHAEPAAAHAQSEAQPSGHGESEEHGSGWLATIAKAFNFAVLVAVLVYFLKSPLATYLSSRISRVREDLVAAAATREEASRRLADIRARLESLPSELEALKARGAEEIVAERERIEQAAAAERQRLLEHTRREIEMHYRIARRQILEQTAAMAVSVASERIKATMTPEDQARLIDRYAGQLAGGAS